MSLRTEAEIAQEGEQAFSLGQGRNPYIPGNWDYKAWERGYYNAQRKQRGI